MAMHGLSLCSARIGRKFLFQFIQCRDAGGQLGFFGEEDGDSVADGIAQAAFLGDKEISVPFQAAAGDGTAHDFKELIVDDVHD